MMRGGGGGGGGGAWMRGIDESEKIDRSEAKRVLRRALRMLGPYRWAVVGAFVVMILSTVCVLAGPALVRYGIDHGLRKKDSGALNLAAGLYLVVAFGFLICSRSQILIVTRVGEKFLRDLRVRVFDHMQAM